MISYSRISLYLVPTQYLLNKRSFAQNQSRIPMMLQSARAQYFNFISNLSTAVNCCPLYDVRMLLPCPAGRGRHVDSGQAGGRHYVRRKRSKHICCSRSELRRCDGENIGTKNGSFTYYVITVTAIFLYPIPKIHYGERSQIGKLLICERPLNEWSVLIICTLSY